MFKPRRLPFKLEGDVMGTSQAYTPEKLLLNSPRREKENDVVVPHFQRFALLWPPLVPLINAGHARPWRRRTANTFRRLAI